MDKCMKKTITYRLITIFSTILIAILLGIDIEIATFLSIFTEVVHTVIYYFHEKIWEKK
jgi:uncharacterized membrane protein